MGANQQFFQQVMQMLQGLDQKIEAIGSMVQDMHGGGEEMQDGPGGAQSAGVDEAALRAEAMQRLAAQG